MVPSKMGYEQYFAVALSVKAKQLLQNQLSLSRTLVMTAQRGALRILLPLFLGVGATWAWSAPYYEGRIRVTFRDSARGKDIPITITYACDSSSGDNRPLVGTGTGSIPTFGVAVVGHGYQMPVSAYKTLATTICQHPANYVVVLPETGSGLFPNHNDFAQDMAAVASYMQREGKRKGSIWEGHIRDETILAGHSMGGGAAFLAAKAMQQVGSPRLSGVIAFAPAETNPSSSAAAASVTCPTLIMAGGVDCVTPLASTIQPIYDKLASVCKVLAVIPGASHCQFADANTTCNLGELNCKATIARDAQFTRCWQYVNRFLAKNDDVARVIDNTQVQTTMVPLGASVLKVDRSTICVGDTVGIEVMGDVRDLLWLPDSTRGKQIRVVARESGIAISVVRTTCFSTTRLDTVIAVVPRPAVSIEGARRLCPGDSTILRVASNASPTNPLRYLWSTGESSERIVVLRPGNYSVEAVSDRGCGTSAAFATVDVVEIPEVSVSLSGDSIICGAKGDLIATLSGDMDRVRSIEWSTGDTSRSIRLTTPGVYALSARMILRDTLACAFTSDTVSVTLRRYNATVPQITVKSDTLTSSFADTYEWSVDGTSIPGATQREHVARRSGLYRVTTMRADEGGCSATSEPRNVVVSSIAESTRPRPSIRQLPGSIFIDLASGTHVIEIRNVRGQIVFTRSVETSEGQPITIDTSGLAIDPHSLTVDGQPAGLFVPQR